MNLSRINPFIFGMIGSLSLLAFYTTIMLIFTGSFKAAFDQFISLWYFMLPLVISFGIQTALYQSIRFASSTKHIMKGTTTTSTIGMIACCAHHLTDVLPILGLSALSVFLLNYQTPILLFAILFNILGILYLLRIKTLVRR